MSAVEAVARYRWVALGLALLSQWSMALVSQMIPPLAPLFQSELGLSKAEVGMFASAPSLGAWCAVLIGGMLIDRFGVRAMLAFALTVTGALMPLMLTVDSIVKATGLMWLLGLTRGSVNPGATKAILDWFPARARATAMGIKQTGLPIAGLAAAAVLPTLALAVGWRLAMVATGGLVLLSGIVIALLYRNPQGASAAPRPTQVRSALGKMARTPNIWVISLMATLFLFVQQAVLTYLALYFKEVVLVPVVPDERARIVMAGGFLGACQLGGIAGRVGWGIVSDRIFKGNRGPVLVILGVLSVLMSLALAGIATGFPLWLLTAMVFVFGATVVGWNGVYAALVVETVGRTHAGMGVGLTMTVTDAGVVTGPPAFGFVVDATGSYSAAWIFLAVVSAMGTALAVLAARREMQARKRAQTPILVTASPRED